MQRLVWPVCLCLCFFSLSPFAKPLNPAQVPEPLKPWIAWVTQDNPEQICPFLYNSGDDKRCLWPSATQLELKPQQGVFNSAVLVYKDEWVDLPGDAAHWPQNVTVDHQAALVMDRDGVPMVKLLAGAKPPSRHQINGEFFWGRIPDNLPVPMDTGLINLSINGTAIAAPTLRDGQLWLKESESGQKKPENVQNSLDIQVFRLFTDDVPMALTTRLVLDVAGEQREIKLQKPLLDGFAPMSVLSPLPARLEDDGQLLVQVRPGHWQIDVTSHSLKEQDTVALPNQTEGWPEAEIWLFQARPDLRVVEVGQVQAVDTSQSNVPPEWQRLPAYSVTADQAMVLKVIRRGDPEPDANQLTLKRELWLDFDGGGYTANDLITGKISRGWRLDALPAMQVGKVTLNNDNLLVTYQPGGNPPDHNRQGVEVRKGAIILTADSRINGDVGALGAVGWAQDFQKVTAELNLPPGWRLLATDGVDNVPDSWLSRWTLWDLFLVLCAALAVGRLWNPYWGAAALLALVLIWQEPGAPHWVWLHIVAATALLKVWPKDKFLAFLRVVRIYRLLACLVLLGLALPFMVEQVHHGIYPQLEAGEGMFEGGDKKAYPAASLPEAGEEGMLLEEANAPASGVAGGLMPRALRSMAKVKPAAAPMQEANDTLERLDPNAKVQTGPGLPQWHWHKVYLSWNGTVSSQQQLKLWYLSPTATLALNFLRVILVAILALLMFGKTPRWPRRPSPLTATPPVWLGLLLLPVLLGAAPKLYADYPSPELLKELQTRLQDIEPPDCLPACAQIQQMALTLDERQLDMLLQIDAAAPVAVPLPSDYGQWFPRQVLDNGQPATGLYRDGNGLWIQLATGGHRVTLQGPPPLLSQFTLPLPLTPKRANLQVTGWDVLGMQENAVPDGQLQFTRIRQAVSTGKATTLEPGVLPPFMRVERTLQFGLDWRVVTHIRRLSPMGSAVALKVGLLPGEAVNTAGIHVKEGAVEVNMSAQQSDMEWSSTLDKTPTLTLQAANTPQWVEVWQAQISPIWHLDSAGIAMIHNNAGEWLPEWHPWPGETISLRITRPEAVNGQTLTVDNSLLSVKPGQRLQDVTLSFRLRSSQGGQHTITLPDGADLQTVAINGQTLPIRLQGHKLTLPISPGQQDVSVHWQANQPIATVFQTPRVDLGVPSVNSHINMGLGEDRWVFWVQGPRLGPAVLFWGVLLVSMLLAWGLGQIRLTPLQGWQWFLLLVGLSQVPLPIAGLVTVWLLLLGWRRGQAPERRFFNGLQALLAILTLLALGALFSAVAQGLLNAPDMGITGNQSSAFNLNWYQDRSQTRLPIATAMSVPVLVYRLLMLAWALWLAVSLLNWLSWGWGCFSSNGLWHKRPKAGVDEAPDGQAEDGG